MLKKPKPPRSMAADIIGVIRDGTKKWTTTVKSEERSPASRSYRYARMTRERGVSFKEAAAQIMPEAYRKVSGDGALPANARQVMYAARPHIQKVTGRQLNGTYFTQTLLPDYLIETGVPWDIVYDARGHFNEPHDGKSFGIGTLEVRNYLARFQEPTLVAAHLSAASVATCGPRGSFGAVLFLEKEGFDPLLRASQIADKYDLAIMSTKGMSVTAARALADEMCHDHDIPLLLLHDFDKAGFSIAGTLQRDTRRYEFQNSLESEDQFHPKGEKAALMANLRENGATEAEIAFMFADFDATRSTRRVELNAMTSPQFIAFLERKLKEAGVAKIIPEKKLLDDAYVCMERGRWLQEAVGDLVDEGIEDRKAPKGLRSRIEEMLNRQPTMRWDEALAEIVATRKGKRGINKK
jgi:hypothetical protein